MKKSLRIAVASGKGGTGKTTVAVALAMAAGATAQLLDCDVEEPNAHLFFRVNPDRTEMATVPLPKIDAERCTGCGACAEFCAYHALARLGKTILVFPELCHSCGGCVRLCPAKAIREEPHPIGSIDFSRSEPVELVTGRLQIGCAMSPPLIRQVNHFAQPTGLTVIDCPPGTSCPLVAAAKNADFVLLVTEPTPFGQHDLSLAVKVMRKLGIPCGVILNRADGRDRRIQDFCRTEKLPLLLEIAERRDIAVAGSRGEPLLAAAPELTGVFRELPRRIAGMLAGERSRP